MRFTELFNSEAVNPNTGAIVTGIRVRTDNGRVYKVSNTIDELKAHGNMTKVLNDLLVIDGEFGAYVKLPRYTALATISWDDAKAEPTPEATGKK